MEMKRKGRDSHTNLHELEKNMKNKTGGYISDSKLVPRVQQYVDSHRNEATISVSAMAEYLQARYTEYGRKKKNAFRISVERAYETICRQKNADRCSSLSELEKKHLEKKRKTDTDSVSGSDSSESFSEDNDDYVQYEETNAVNSLLTGMYKKVGVSQQKSGAGGKPHGWATTHGATLSPPGVNSVRAASAASQRLSLSCPASPLARECNGLDEDNNGLYTIDRTPTPLQNNAKSDRKDTRKQKTMHSPAAKLKHTSKHSPQAKVWKGLSDDVVVAMEIGETKAESGKQTDTSTNNTSGIDSPVSIQPARMAVKASQSRPKKKQSSKKVADTDKKETGAIQQSSIKFADIGGSEQTLQEVCQLLVHMKHPEVYEQLGVIPPRGFLLHGPPGCGKTLLAHAIAGELELPFLKLAATEIVSGVSGESEEKLRDIFDKAQASAPCILFLDEIDAITPKRETASKDMERRIVSQLLTCMDDLNSKSRAHVLVIGATNRPDSIDPALRRAGRFDREISLGIPDEQARKRILEVQCRGLRLETGFDFGHLAHLTPGFVGADLTALAREAAITAVNRVFNKLQQSGSNDRSESVSESRSMQPMKVTTETSACPEAGGPDVGIMATAMASSLQSNNVICNTVKQSTQDKSPIQLTNSIAVNETVSVENIDCVATATDAGHLQQAVTSDNTCNDSISISCQNVTSSESQENKEDVDIKSDNTVEASSCHETSSILVAETHAMEDCSERQGDSGNQTSTSDMQPCKQQQQLNAVLYWLKEQPPLSEDQLATLRITKQDFMEAVQRVQPSAKREGFATVPDVTWDDIGALHDIRQELQMAIMAPVQHAEQFKSLGLTNPPGILLAGPPGCGKTLLAKAIANESGINFISVKGPELLNMYVGESERAVRQVFQRARNSAPCVVFFDELDALCPRRTGSSEGGASVRVVNQLLTEMDGLEERKQVFIMAATNRPDIIDPAILRPGRLDKTLYVGLPTPADCYDILQTLTKHGTQPLLAPDVNLRSIAEQPQCQGFTGADLAALVREASVCALREFLASHKPDCKLSIISVHAEHFDLAFTKVKPSVSAKDHRLYERMKNT